ncbi:ScbR family autoregulator-binding transcription factor [Streptomyces sp. B1I3]|uniref:ScbR family autoregulator-binding transcription factor n=1 Tax=Streptomyces sp. B1I3 TaxID=3042264 RepID=UPI002786C598|nr:ScbR family autoregulator-binding transcription factor [Streptomyces sp. B1I3]MDQ0794840.1 AcrR family transcriptional regulator [Streptomyces sp. B1I3]
MSPSLPPDGPEPQAPLPEEGGKQERAVRTRQALIRSAAEQFERHGYEKTRLSEVSNGAGVTSGALHFHFRSKTELAAAVESAAVRSLYRAAWRAQQEPVGALQTLIDVTHALMRLLYEDVVARAGLRLNSEAASERLCRSLRHGWQSCVQQLLARAADRGELAGTPAPPHLAGTVTAATTGYEVLARENREWLSHRAVTELWQLLLPGAVTPDTLAGLRPEGTADLLCRAGGSTP